MIGDVVDEVVVVLKDRLFFGSVWGWLFCEVVKGVRVYRVLLMYCVACMWRCSLIGRMWVLSCKCCMFVSVVQPVAM